MQAVTERNRSPDPAVLDDVVARILAAVPARRILLFGSAARGEMGPHSDLDLLVVVPDGHNTLHVAQALQGRMRHLGYATDILVAQESDLEQYGDNPYLIYHTALTEGKELHHVAR